MDILPELKQLTAAEQQLAEHEATGPYEAKALDLAAESLVKLAKLLPEELELRTPKIVAIITNGAEWCRRFDLRLREAQMALAEAVARVSFVAGTDIPETLEKARAVLVQRCDKAEQQLAEARRENAEWNAKCIAVVTPDCGVIQLYPALRMIGEQRRRNERLEADVTALRQERDEARKGAAEYRLEVEALEQDVILEGGRAEQLRVLLAARDAEIEKLTDELRIAHAALNSVGNILATQQRYIESMASPSPADQEKT